MEKYVLAVDQSTSATKAILFDKKGEIIDRFDKEHRQFYPEKGFVEHDAEEIYKNTLELIEILIKKNNITTQDIAAIGISNQRETALVWDKNTGKPVAKAAVWQCQRGSKICEEMSKLGFAELVRQKTGLVLSPYFSASKIKWLLDNVEGVRERAEKGELLFGTIDSWLLFKLTGGKVHATDYSNASRTQLFNINNLKWDEELLKLFTIPAQMAPEVKYSNEVFGYTTCDGLFDKPVPIAGLMGDSHAALFGQNCFEKGMAKATYGTGSSIMMNIGKKAVFSKKGLVTSLAWGINGSVDYVLEGNINCSGATIKWLVDDLELIEDSKSSGKIAGTVQNNGGVYVVPAFVGLGAPYWDSHAKAAIIGISRDSKKAHIVRAAEESIAYQVKDIIDLMLEESALNLKELRVDGGPTNDSFLMQFQTDMLSVPVVCGNIEELSALGTAFAAGLAVGFWGSIEEIGKLRKVRETYNSVMCESTRNLLYEGWKQAVARVLTEINTI